MKPLLTIKQVCELLQLKERTVRSLISTWKLKSFKVSGSIRVAEEDLAAYIASCRQDTKAEHEPPQKVTLRHLRPSVPRKGKN